MISDDKPMLVGRRGLLLMLAAVVAVPVLRVGSARADEPVHVVPEDSGAVPWT
jgi:hypothetical protein